MSQTWIHSADQTLPFRPAFSLYGWQWLNGKGRDSPPWRLVPYAEEEDCNLWCEVMTRVALIGPAGEVSLCGSSRPGWGPSEAQVRLVVAALKAGQAHP